MAKESRAAYIKALAEKFIKLVESLEPGERLSITKIAAVPKRAKSKRAPAAKPKQARRKTR